MALTFRSSTPEKFVLTGVDTDGRKRSVTATKDGFYWDLMLRHPSGMSWPGRFHGPNVLDAMSEMMRSHDVEFKQDRARGDRPRVEPYDYNRSANELAESPIVQIPRKW